MAERAGSTWNMGGGGRLLMAATAASPFVAGLVYAAGYYEGLGREKAWIALSVAVAHAVGNSLGTATGEVTAAAIVVSWCAAAASWAGGGVLGPVAFVLTAAPIALTLAVWPAEVFLAVAVMLALLGALGSPGGRERRWVALRRNAFPALAALSFLFFAPGYDVARLTEAIVVSAGLSLLLRATAP